MATPISAASTSRGFTGVYGSRSRKSCTHRRHYSTALPCVFSTKAQTLRMKDNAEWPALIVPKAGERGQWKGVRYPYFISGPGAGQADS